MKEVTLRAHVILMNDSVEYVVVERDRSNLFTAIQKLEVFAAAYFVKHRWSFDDDMHPHRTAVPYSPAWCSYLARCRWHVRTVDAQEN